VLYEFTVHPLAGALLSLAPVLRCEHTPTHAHPIFPFTSSFYQACHHSGTAMPACLPACLSYDLEGFLLPKLLFGPLLQKQSQLGVGIIPSDRRSPCTASTLGKLFKLNWVQWQM
jgi:hypothetical protein